MRWVPPRKSNPRWMRSVMLASRPCFEKLFGIPNIPNRNASRIPTISANFQVRFLFMRKLDPLLTSLRGELALRAADGVGAYEPCRPYRTRAQPIHFPGTCVPGQQMPPLRGFESVTPYCFFRQKVSSQGLASRTSKTVRFLGYLVLVSSSAVVTCNTDALVTSTRR